MAQVLREGPHNGAFIMSGAPAKRSRENLVVAGGLLPGTVLGAVGGTATDTLGGIEAGGFGGASGILINASPEGDPLYMAVMVRDCEVNGKALRWTQSDEPEDQPSDADIAAGVAALADLGIIVRDDQPAAIGA